MIPYIESHTFQIGPLTLQTWGTLVALGFVTATAIAARRAKQKNLDPKIVWDLAFWILISAMAGARLFHAIFYEPQYYLQNPLKIFDLRDSGFAIMGGFLAAAAVVWFYVKKRGLDFLAYADILVWGVPWGCGIGRIGCFLIHDHPGTLSSFILAVKYPDGQTRHDLGLYLSVLGFAIGILFLVFNYKLPATSYKPHPGFWLGIYLSLYGCGRFLLDFLRIIDTRILGLTPTQWLLIPVAIFGFWLVIRDQNKYPFQRPLRGVSGATDAAIKSE
ncbi:MAG: prolipoprotein diacylglyceryl transferase [Patescibacteria group bacterium]